MTLNIQTAHQVSEQALHELITHTLDKIIGPNYELITAQLPFDGNHILAMNVENRPVVISHDKDDGGMALLSGIAALEKLTSDSNLIYRSYPRLAEISPSSDDLLTTEAVQLVILSPREVPGTMYLNKVLHNISFYTYHVLKINDDIGLYIETSNSNDDEKYSINLQSAPQAEFRTGRTNLSKEEELFFQEM